MQLETLIILALALLAVAYFYFYVLPKSSIKKQNMDRDKTSKEISPVYKTSYNWRCSVCDSTGQTNQSTCAHCNAPSSLTGDELIAWKNNFKAILKSKSPDKSFSCIKCQHNEFKAGFIRTSGGTASASFEMETEQFTYMACSNCGFTEFYSGKVTLADRLLDLAI